MCVLAYYVLLISFYSRLPCHISRERQLGIISRIARVDSQQISIIMQLISVGRIEIERLHADYLRSFTCLLRSVNNLNVNRFTIKLFNGSVYDFTTIIVTRSFICGELTSI